MPFDFQVDHYNSEGKVIRRNPYRMEVSAEKGTRMERPPGSGLWYAPDGSLVEDQTKEIRERQEAQAAQAKAKADAELAAAKAAEREAIKAELLAEMELEKAQNQKAQNGSNRKA